MYTIYGVGLIPVILGLVEVAKRSKMPTVYAPLAALGFGILAGLAVAANKGGHFDPIYGIVIGVEMGLAASGLWAGITTLTSS